MAKKKETGTDLVPAQETALATVGSSLPDFLKGYAGPLGTEDITSDDLNIPRLKVGQSMSNEVKEGDVEEGDMFINVNGQIIAPDGEKLPFIVLRRWKEYVLWRPQEDGGGILARANLVDTPNGPKYAWDNANASFDVKIKGVQPVTWRTGKYIEDDGLAEWGSEVPGDKKSKKAATEHHNYVVVLPSKDNMVVAMSWSRTASTPAKNFNADLKMSNVPLQARLFTVETVDAAKDKFKFKNVKFRPAGFVQEAAVFEQYKAMADAFKGKKINVDLSDGGDAEAEVDERA